MDIIEVSRLKATLDEATFDLNAVLEAPLEEGSKEKFAKALYKYSQAALQLDTLFRLQQQIDKINEQPAPHADVSSATKDSNET